MAIRKYLTGASFTPEAVAAMSQALEATVEALAIRDDAKRETVAKIIVQLALWSDKLSATELSERALAALRGPP
jgi:hypothetical protein